MVVKMMRWRPWPPLMSSNKKFEVKLIVRRIEGVVVVVNNNKSSSDVGGGGGLLMVEIRWKGTKVALSSLRRRSVVKNFTKEEQVSDDGVVEWNEEFQSLSNLSFYKDNVFHPWEISFTLFNVLNQGSKKKVSVVGTALLNLAEFASIPEQKEFEINVPLILSGSSCVESHPSLCLSLNLLELRTANETPETAQRSISPIPSSPLSGEALSSEKDELSALKAGLRKVKIFKEYVSTRRSKKACREGEDSEGRFSSRSEDAEYTYPFDTESTPDDFNEEEELEENKDYATDRKSFSYGTLAHANCAGGLYYSEMRVNGDYEDWVYYSNRKSDVGCLPVVDTTTSITDQSLTQSSKRSILSWRKRKLSFRSPKAKGEPLLKKSYGEEGGDDIDFDRRQLNSSDESLALGWHKGEDGSTTNRSSISEFGDDNFAIGSWEHKELVSRDGHMKLLTQVFFASIDQRSERAAGESACTALVAVIADWFQTNQDLMPIKSQFDSLIRDGSPEWRNLCENETYMERFPDKHFDLETVLQAKIRSLTVSSPKSFIGFFHPGGMDDGGLDFLDGAMSFDSIWDEISRTGSDCHSNGIPQVYIVSWNDHFFVLKVEPEAYYIIDTLGERLYEGCNQAYILKFDRETAIHSVFNEARSSEAKPASGDKQQIVRATASSDESEITEAKEEEVVVCKGKESCKEYIKSFLAAIPIRELQVDIKKGLSTSVHSRLQIEFHYTEYLKPTPEPQAAEATIAPTATQVMLATEVVAC